jgi:hypothetical protein
MVTGQIYAFEDDYDLFFLTIILFLKHEQKILKKIDGSIGLVCR